MLTVAEAFHQVLSTVQRPEPETAPLTAALDLILARDLQTPHDSPPFDKSMMDGFAVQSAGFTTKSSRRLSVSETITAGTVPRQSVTPDSAARIMTGAPLPAGADCVVPIELAQVDTDDSDQVTLAADNVSAERHVLRQGCLARTGTPLMSTGTRLQPQQIAVLAEFGLAQVPVFRRATVAVLATGDELVDIAEPLTPGRIRNSNEPMLVAQIRRAGAEAIPLGVARDRRDDLSQHIRAGLQHDFLLLSGGVSAGTLDLVPAELAAAGVQQVFHKIAMKPGKPLWFGELKTEQQRCWVFGLPGNPVSSMVCFELFVRTALRKFSGWTDPLPQHQQARLIRELSIRGDRPTYYPVSLQPSDSGLTATPVAWGGSADLRSTAQADGMGIFEPQSEAYAAGTLISVIAW